MTRSRLISLGSVVRQINQDCGVEIVTQCARQSHIYSQSDRTRAA